VEVIKKMNQTATPEKKTGNGVDDNVKNAGFGSSQSSQSTSSQSSGATGYGSSQQGGASQSSGSTGYGSSQQGMSSGMQQNQQSEPQRHSEGVVARTIEEQTAKLPSDTFLWGAVAAMGVSAFFEFTGAKDKSRFVGQWVAPLLLFGVYNKLVKQQGSDRVSA
jgi:hypothetical protein